MQLKNQATKIDRSYDGVYTISYEGYDLTIGLQIHYDDQTYMVDIPLIHVDEGGISEDLVNEWISIIASCLLELGVSEQNIETISNYLYNILEELVYGINTVIWSLPTGYIVTSITKTSSTINQIVETLEGEIPSIEFEDATTQEIPYILPVTGSLDVSTGIMIIPDVQIPVSSILGELQYIDTIVLTYTQNNDLKDLSGDSKVSMLVSGEIPDVGTIGCSVVIADKYTISKN